MSVRLVRVAGGGAGWWDRHAATAGGGPVWRGDFARGSATAACAWAQGGAGWCVLGGEHQGVSAEGADLVLFQRVG